MAATSSLRLCLCCRLLMCLLFCVFARGNACVINELISSCPCKGKTDANISDTDCVYYRTDKTTPNGCLPKNEQAEFISSRNLPVNVTIVAIPYHEKKQKTLLGINVTVTVIDKRVKGFSLKPVNHGHKKKNICRYYDFQNTKVSVLGATFYNAELFFDISAIGPLIFLDVGVFLDGAPDVWSRYFLTPIYPTAIDELPSICSWSSFIVVGTMANADNSIDVSFTQAPNKFGVSSYLVQALSAETGDDQTVVWGQLVAADNGSAVRHVMIHGLSQCNSFKLRVKCVNDCCDNSTTATFTQSCQDDDALLATSITVVILALITVSVIMYVCLRKYQRNIKDFNNSPRKKVFLVYSYDVAGHGDVIEKFARFLQNCCHCTVILDIWGIQNQDPDVWIRKSITECDYVIIVWSRGACLHMDKNNPKILTKQLSYLASFGSTITAILAEFHQHLRSRFYHRNLNKFVNVSFDYSRSSSKRSVVEVPGPFNMLPHLRLPRRLERLACRLHCTSTNSFDLFAMTGGFHGCSWWPTSHTHPLLSTEMLTATPEGRSLTEAIDSMRLFERNNFGWFEALLIDAPLEPRSIITQLSTSSDDELRVSGGETGETDVGEDDDDERYSSSSQLNRFPPDISGLPIFGDDLVDVQCSHWPPSGDGRRFSDDSLPSLPSDVFQFGMELGGN